MSLKLKYSTSIYGFLGSAVILVLERVGLFTIFLDIKLSWQSSIIFLLICLIIALLLAFYQLYNQQTHYAQSDDLKIWQEQYENNVRIIRIFASGSETYRTRLISFLSSVQANNTVEIKVLMRTDGTPNRTQKIDEAVRKWKDDIDDNFRTRTAIKIYNSEVMLRGVIFDDKSALLGWYYRDNVRGTQGANIPVPLLINKIDSQSKIIDFAIKTFDHIYDGAQNVN